MSALVPFVIFGLIAGGVYYVGYATRRRRRRAVQALAARVGFTYTPVGYDIPKMPFSFFAQGKGRKAQLVISGTHNNLPMELFDYEYYYQGGRSRDYRRFTCAVLTIPAACPPLRLSHENTLSRLTDHLVHHDIELEYDDFNRRFQVNCEERKFAFALLDGQMMQWLLEADKFQRVEVVGPWVLIVAPRLSPASWLNLGSWLDAFHEHIPPIVYSAYPRG